MLPVGFDKEVELESSIAEVKAALFGERRIYLESKKLIGNEGAYLCMQCSLQTRRDRKRDAMRCTGWAKRSCGTPVNSKAAPA